MRVFDSLWKLGMWSLAPTFKNGSKILARVLESRIQISFQVFLRIVCVSIRSCGGVSDAATGTVTFWAITSSIALARASAAETHQKYMAWWTMTQLPPTQCSEFDTKTRFLKVFEDRFWGWKILGERTNGSQSKICPLFWVMVGSIWQYAHFQCVSKSETTPQKNHGRFQGAKKCWKVLISLPCCPEHCLYLAMDSNLRYFRVSCTVISQAPWSQEVFRWWSLA